MFYAWFLATQKNLIPTPTCWVSLLLVRLFCRRFALAVHGGDNMVDPWVPKLRVRNFQVNWADGIFPYENDPFFGGQVKTTAVFIPQKKKKRIHWAMDLYKKTWLFPKHRKKKVDNCSTVKKNSMVWGCTAVLRKRKTQHMQTINHIMKIKMIKNVQYPLSQTILCQTNIVLDFLLQYGRPCSPFLREILLVCHLQYSPIPAFPTGPCNTHTSGCFSATFRNFPPKFVRFLHSRCLKLTVHTCKKKAFQKRKYMFQPSIFSENVSFREGIIHVKNTPTKKDAYTPKYTLQIYSLLTHQPWKVMDYRASRASFRKKRAPQN